MCRVHLGAGHLRVTPGSRDRFVARSLAAVIAARAVRGCLDFAVSADPVDPDRVNIFERWESEDALRAFRASGPNDDLFDDIVAASITEHTVGGPSGG